MKHLLRYLSFVFLLSAVLPLSAQNCDYLTLEALIADHKKMKTPIIMRSLLEGGIPNINIMNNLGISTDQYGLEGNRGLHGTARDEIKEYHAVNDTLDKYTRCFDYINLAFESVHLVINFYQTFTDVGDKIQSFKNMLDRYYNECLATGHVQPSDTVIISLGYRMCDKIYDNAKDIYKSGGTLVGYASGALACTTEGLMVQLESINTSLDNIRYIIGHYHFMIWRYITLRTCYWTKAIFLPRTKREICESAIGRWRQSGYGRMRDAMGL